MLLLLDAWLNPDPKALQSLFPFQSNMCSRRFPETSRIWADRWLILVGELHPVWRKVQPLGRDRNNTDCVDTLDKL